MSKYESIIKVLIITDTKEEAVKFFDKHFWKEPKMKHIGGNVIAITPMCTVYWMKTGTIGHGMRFNYIFAKKETTKTDWFNSVVEPMQCAGIAIIEDMTCKDCEHLMFSDCYGECSIGEKGIAQPNDSCDKFKKSEKITDMIDLFYANKHMHDRLKENERCKNGQKAIYC